MYLLSLGEARVRPILKTGLALFAISDLEMGLFFFSKLKSRLRDALILFDYFDYLDDLEFCDNRDFHDYLDYLELIVSLVSLLFLDFLNI